MKVKRRTVITIETDRVVILRGRGRVEEWCELCARYTLTLSPEEAAIFTGVSSNTIARWVELGSIHVKESPDGGRIVCLDSLKSRANSKWI